MTCDLRWFYRGVQSAVFYYISCGPCYDASYKRKRRKDARRDRKERNLLRDERPDVYQHPPPFEINEYWQEEMTLGPTPPPRRKRKATKDSGTIRAITTSGTFGSVGSSVTESVGGPREPGQVHTASWGKNRYRRPDEEFTWVEVEEPDEPESQDLERSGATAGWQNRSVRAPAVNDLHPPVVSFVPTKAEDRRWMRQPPPSAAFIAGKTPASAVNKPGSVVSKSASAAKPPVSRQTSRVNTKSAPLEITSRSGSHADSVIDRPISRGVGKTTVSASGQDNALLTLKQGSKHRVTSNSTSAATSDADDEDEAPERPSTSGKSRASRRLDVSTPSSKPNRSRSRTQNQQALAAIPSQDLLSRPSSSLRPQSPSENISPRLSPQSNASRPYSRISLTSDSDNGSSPPNLQSPNFGKPRKSPSVASGNKSATRQDTSRASSRTPRASSKQRKSTITDPIAVEPTPALLEQVSLEHIEASGVDSAIMIDDTDLDVSYEGLDEDKVRERMWLGAQGEDGGRLAKRWSSEF